VRVKSEEKPRKTGSNSANCVQKAKFRAVKQLMLGVEIYNVEGNNIFLEAGDGTRYTGAVPVAYGPKYRALEAAALICTM
jgi:hypothetical protein